MTEQIKEKLAGAVAVRRSVRSFASDFGDMDELVRTARSFAASFAPQARFRIEPVKVTASSFGASYGVIRGTHDYLALVTGDGATGADVMAAAYCMELTVLSATAMGAATCWVGGTFRQHAFGALAPGPGERIAAVVAVGTAAERPSLSERIMRRLAHAGHRRPFAELFFDGDFATPYPADGPLGRAFSLVRMAPSALNRQPWRMVARRDTAAVDLCAVADPGYLMLDTGIAMAHFDLAAPAGEWMLSAPDGAAPRGSDPLPIARRSLV